MIRDSSSIELTCLLQAWSAGDSSALDRLAPIVYAELHRLARRNLAAEREGWHLNFVIYGLVYLLAVVFWLMLDARKPVEPEAPTST